MKNKLWSILGGCIVTITFSMSSAHALLTTFQLDNKIGSYDSSNSGAQTEKDFIEGIVGVSLTQEFKIEDNFTVTENDHDNDSVADSWFLDVDPSEPGFFLLKFGVGTLAVHDVYAFENLTDLTKLVFSDDQINNLFTIKDIESLSHYTGFSGEGSGTGTGVPEPGILILLGVGLLGLTATRRKKNHNH